MKCKNCDHELYYDPSTKQLHHYTRCFHASGYPYSDVKCFHGPKNNWCSCEKPELKHSEILNDDDKLMLAIILDLTDNGKKSIPKEDAVKEFVRRKQIQKAQIPT